METTSQYVFYLNSKIVYLSKLSAIIEKLNKGGIFYLSKQATREQAIVQRYLNGKSVVTIARETKIPRNTLYQ